MPKYNDPTMQQVAARKVEVNQGLKEAKEAHTLAKEAERQASRLVNSLEGESAFLLSCKKAFAAQGNTWHGVYIMETPGYYPKAYTEATLAAALELEWYRQEQYGKAKGVTREEYAAEAKSKWVKTAHTYFAEP